MYRATQLYPDLDLGPLDYLLNESFTPNKDSAWTCGNLSACDPPQYNSVGFMLLGLAVAAVTGASSWDQLDQAGALPAAIRHDPDYNDLLFFRHGTCASYGPKVAHFYAGGPPPYIDQYNKSCLNGFAFGNVGASAAASATFFWHLLGREPRVVSPESVVEMTQFGEVMTLHRWERYGLGLMWLPMERYAELNPNVTGTEPYMYVNNRNPCANAWRVGTSIRRSRHGRNPQDGTPLLGIQEAGRVARHADACVLTWTLL